jgi:glycogen(starch) synthase
MKVLIYSNSFAPQVGGVETFVMLLARGLATRTVSLPIKVTVATSTPKSAFDESTFPFRIVRKAGIAELAGLIRNTDVVQLAGPSFLVLLLAWLMRRPVIVEHHGYPPICPNGLLFYEPTKSICPGHFRAHRFSECLRCNAVNVGRLKSLLMLLGTFPRRWLCMRVAVNVPITEHVRKRLDLPRSQVIYYGVPDVTSDSLVRGSARFTASPLIFAYIGRFVTLKGLPMILHAARRLQEACYNFRLKFIGDGPDLAELKSIAGNLALSNRVEFTGYLGGPALEKAMNETDVVLMPSIWEETAGLSAIEHMMRGRLVIVSDIAGLGEVVGDAGLRFPAGNVDGLTACMKTVLDHPETIGRLGAAARSRALQIFSERRMVDDYIALYERVLQHSTSPATTGAERRSL